MADDDPNPNAQEPQKPGPKPPAADPSATTAITPITPEYVDPQKALSKLEKPEVLSLAAFFSSKMTLGPDPETAKVMAETEMHHETCRLNGYKENLKFQDEDGKRDHAFRMKRQNHSTFLLTSILAGALAGAGVGLYLTIKHEPVGSNILIASIGTIIYIISGKTPFHHSDE
jgi:hypothetical protein